MKIKKYLITGFAVVLLISATVATTMLVMPQKEEVASAATSTVTPTPTERKITVNGQGAIKVKPDVAYVTLGVQTESKDAKEAQAQNTKLMNSVIESVKAIGVAEKDIKTSGYSMYPNYNYNNKVQKITGYNVTNNVTVTVRNIEKTGDIIDTSITVGANMTSSIQFNISDPTPFYQKALTAAMENAKIKGTTIAESLDVTLNLPLEVIEQPAYYAPTQYENMNMKEAQYDSASGTSIQTGELEVSATVQIIYSY